MKFKILTLFPEMFSPLYSGIVGAALKKRIFELELFQIRDYTSDKHKKVDDTPFGGGSGMVMTCQPVADAIKAADKHHEARRIYVSPRGRTLDQRLVKELSREKELLILCGSYEGIDERVIESYIDEEISIGDYVLTSGELAAQVIVNSVVRYVDGVLGDCKSLTEESFSERLLEYPQYTKPQEFEGKKVPDILLSGNHAEIAKWRRQQQIKITKERRPDLLVNSK